MTWKRGERGWVTHLMEIEPRAVVSNYGESATFTVPLDMAGAADEKLIDERQRVMQILQAGQQYGFDVSFTAVAVAPPLPGAQPNTQVAPQWREIAWAMRGVGLSPERVIEYFDGPGYRIKSITARFNDGLINWELEGSQYVLP